DRCAERQDQGLCRQARVARCRRGGRGRAGRQRPAAGFRARRGDRAVPAAAASGVTRAARFAAAAVAALLLAAPAAPATERLRVSWHPKRPHPGDVAWVHVSGAGETAAIEGSLGPRSLTFFPYAGGQAAVVGID